MFYDPFVGSVLLVRRMFNTSVELFWSTFTVPATLNGHTRIFSSFWNFYIGTLLFIHSGIEHSDGILYFLLKGQRSVICNLISISTEKKTLVALFQIYTALDCLLDFIYN